MVTTWTILDPNLIAVEAGNEIDPRFLFHWFQRFDLRSITEPGPTPQLNKKNLVPLLIAHPATKDEQAELAAFLDTFDRAVLVQQQARAAAEELIQSTLASAMTNDVLLGDIDVDTSLLIA